MVFCKYSQTPDEYLGKFAFIQKGCFYQNYKWVAPKVNLKDVNMKLMMPGENYDLITPLFQVEQQRMKFNL